MANLKVNVRDVLKNGVYVATTAFTPNGEGGYSGDIYHWHYAVSLAILEELQKLNALLHCRNAVDIPSILRRIDKNTKKRPRKKVKT